MHFLVLHRNQLIFRFVYADSQRTDPGSALSPMKIVVNNNRQGFCPSVVMCVCVFYPNPLLFKKNKKKWFTWSWLKKIITDLCFSAPFYLTCVKIYCWDVTSCVTLLSVHFRSIRDNSSWYCAQGPHKWGGQCDAEVCRWWKPTT